MSDFKVMGIAGPRHPTVPRYVPLLITEHVGVASAQMEVEAWQRRMREKPGTVDCCHLYDLRPDSAMTTLHIDANMKLEWR